LIENLILEKNYLYAVDLIDETIKKVESEQLRNVVAIEEINKSIQKTKRNIHEFLIEELQKHIYVQTKSQNPKKMMKTIIDSLEKLGKISETQSFNCFTQFLGRLIQLVGFKLRSIMELFIKEFISKFDFKKFNTKV
jgi:DUF1009 family protein